MPDGDPITVEELERYGTRVDRLQPGSRFATVSAPARGGKDVCIQEEVIGVVERVGLTSTAVRIFRAYDNDLIYWAGETKVIPIQDTTSTEDNTMATATAKKSATPAKKSSPPAAATTTAPTQAKVQAAASQNAMGKALQARYNFQFQKRATAISDDDGQAVDSAQAALDRIEAEAAKVGIELVEPEEAATLPSADEIEDADATPPTPAHVPPSVAGKERVAQRATQLAKERADRPAGAVKDRKPKKAKVLRPCLDGCGELVGGNFKMGHDAKLKSLILKIERGDESRDQLPEIAQGLVKFKNGEVQTEKKDGKVVSKVQLLICTAAPVRFPGREIALTEREAD